MTYDDIICMRTDAITIDRALKSRTGSYWDDVAAGVYGYDVIKAILRLNGVTYYDDESTASVCFKTKLGILEVGIINNEPYSNYVCYIDNKHMLVKGYKDRLKKSDYGADIIVELIP